MKLKLSRKLAQWQQTKLGTWAVQFVKFGLVGVSNTLLSLAVTYGVMAFFRLCLETDSTLSLNISTTVGYVAGVCNSYFWNRRYVFTGSQERSGKKAFAKVFVCYGATYLLSMLLMDILVVYCGVPTILAPIPRLLFTIPLNFIANKLWAFKDK